MSDVGEEDNFTNPLLEFLDSLRLGPQLSSFESDLLKCLRNLVSSRHMKKEIGHIINDVHNYDSSPVHVKISIESFKILFGNMGYKPIHASEVIRRIADKTNKSDTRTYDITYKPPNHITQLEKIKKMRDFAYMIRVALVHIYSKTLHKYTISLESVFFHFLENDEHMFLAYLWAYFEHTENQKVIHEFQKALPKTVELMLEDRHTDIFINYNKFRNYIPYWSGLMKDKYITEPFDYPMIKSKYYKNEMKLSRPAQDAIQDLGRREYDFTLDEIHEIERAGYDEQKEEEELEH